MKIIDDINKLVKQVNAEEITLPKIKIEKSAIDLVPMYLNENKYHEIALVMDGNTRKAAGNQLEEILLRANSFHIEIIELTPNRHGQIIADEKTITQLFVEIPRKTDVIAAVGSGTIHDVVRFAGYKMNIPFISVPTAASVDGFTSKGAPLIIRGVKKTIQTASPVAVFADINIIKEAPQEMTAAGFGDIIGKYTSLLDWKISSLVGDEPYNQLAADLTKRSLEACVDNTEEIAKREEKGIKILMQSLIESGLVMLVLNFSKPASGSEHHLSHYWEMDLLQKDTKQLLHGAKVGVATTIIIDLFKKMVTNFDRSSFSSGSSYAKNFIDNWEEIKILIEELPRAEEVKRLLRLVGGSAEPEDLNMNNELIARSLNEAFLLRERCTGLFLINQFKKEAITYPIEKIPL